MQHELHAAKRLGAALISSSVAVAVAVQGAPAGRLGGQLRRRKVASLQQQQLGATDK